MVLTQKKIFFRWAPAAAFAVLFAAHSLATESANPNADLVQATLLADTDAAVPGKSFTLGVRLKMKEHWHTYWANPGESGTPTTIKLTGPDGFAFGAVQWPIPKVIPAPGGIAYGYDGEVLLMVPVTVAKQVAVGAKASILADVTWLSCNKTCVEGGAKLSIDLPVAADAKPVSAELFADSKQRLAVATDQPPASGMVSNIEQPAGPDGAPSTEFAVHWKQPPAKVQWFPLSTPAVAIEDVVVKHDGNLTRVQFKPTIYKGDQIPGGLVEGVLVYEDPNGRRFGVSTTVRVGKAG